MNNFGSYPSFDPLDQANLRCFLTYVIKVDKREVLRLYFEHIYVLLLFLVYPGKLPSYSQGEYNFGSYTSFDALDQVNLRCF